MPSLVGSEMCIRDSDHRGASGAEVASGDGAGVLTQVPDEFLRAVAGFALPDPVAGAATYAVGMAFLPTDDAGCSTAVEKVAAIAAGEGLRVLGWRDVPTDPTDLGPTARSVMPRFRQVFLAGDPAERGPAEPGPAEPGLAEPGAAEPALAG